MTATKALMITGGDVPYEFDVFSYDFVLAVDGGLAATVSMNIRPNVILGDFDTVDARLLATYENMKDIEIIRLNPMKDDTDTQAGLHLLMERGYTQIDVLGATGSRIDHTFANLFLLKYALEHEIELCYYSPLSKIYIIQKQKKYKKSDFYGKYISFLPFDGCALDVTMKGFLYNVSHFDFDTRKNYRFGVSNEALEEEAEIYIGEGYMLVIESLEDKE